MTSDQWFGRNVIHYGVESPLCGHEEPHPQTTTALANVTCRDCWDCWLALNDAKNQGVAVKELTK